MKCLLLLLLVEVFPEAFGQDCTPGFSQDLVRGNTTIPEGTVVLAPFLTFTCDGYITHVSVGYEVTDITSNQTVYLQLRRRVEGVAYSLINEVMLPRGEPEGGGTNHSILRDYELPGRVEIQENDVIGFRTPAGSSVAVLVVTTNTTNRQLLFSANNTDVFDSLVMKGLPQISVDIIERKCVSLLDDAQPNSNTSQSIGILASVQVFFPDIIFHCNGVITQLQTWFQVRNGPDIVNTSIQFQVWIPVDDSTSTYELVSEVTVPSAVDERVITVDNLMMPFYEGSIAGVYILKPDDDILTNFSINASAARDTIDGYYHFTDSRLCATNIFDADILANLFSPEVALLYNISEDMIYNSTLAPKCKRRTSNEMTISTGALVAIIVSSSVCFIAVVTMLIVCCCCCYRKRKSKSRKVPYQASSLNSLYHRYSEVNYERSAQYDCLDSNSTNSYVNPGYANGPTEIYEVLTCEKPYNDPGFDLKKLDSRLAHVKIAREKIILGNEIGSGEFGTVFQGVWRNGKQEVQVAVKTLYSSPFDDTRIKLMKEAAMVEQFLHNNIVRLHGVVLKGNPMMLVLEYLPNGNLLNFLKSNRPGNGESVGQHIPKMLLGFARDVGRGMNYLSNKCFIHRDLAARNILLTEDNVCKIADFGLARDIDDDYYKISNDACLPIKWMPPEVILYQTYTTASDVWSYGILLYEMWSLGHKPYEDYNATDLPKLFKSGYRLQPPPGCPRIIYQAMIQCWHPDFHSRPGFPALLRTISQPPYVLFYWFEEDKQTAGPECDVIGAPIEAGYNLYQDLQNIYK